MWPHVQYMFGRMLTMICDMFSSMKPKHANLDDAFVCTFTWCSFGKGPVWSRLPL